MFCYRLYRTYFFIEDMQAGTEGLSEGSSASTTAEGETRADEVWKPRDVEQDVQVTEAGMVKNDEMVKEEEKEQEVQVEVRKKGDNEQYKFVETNLKSRGHLECTEVNGRAILIL